MTKQRKKLQFVEQDYTYDEIYCDEEPGPQKIVTQKNKSLYISDFLVK